MRDVVVWQATRRHKAPFVRDTLADEREDRASGAVGGAVLMGTITEEEEEQEG